MVGRLRSVQWGPAGLAALACALPTLIYAARRPNFIIDDWYFAAGAHFEIPSTFQVNPGRPLGGLWYAAEFALLGTSPVRHLLLLAAINGVIGALIFAWARRLLPPHLAILTIAVWAALANRGSTRLWIATAPNVVALGVVLAIGLLVLFRPPSLRRHLLAVAALSLSALVYEGALGLAVVVAVVSAWRLPRARWMGLAAAGAALTAAVVFTVVQSPKTGEATLFRGLTRLVPVHAGAGIVPSTLSIGCMLAIFVAVTWAAATLVLPSFATKVEERMVLVGVVLLGAGAATFIGPGFPLGTQGLNDRANVYADVGTAVLLAGALGLLWRLPLRRASVALAAAACVTFASQQIRDIRAFERAGADGKRLLAAFDALPAPVRQGPMRIAPLPNRDGVSAFYYDFDIAAALSLRYDLRPAPDVEIDNIEPDAPELWRLVGRRLVPPPSS